jgi:hypothetical protein
VKKRRPPALDRLPQAAPRFSPWWLAGVVAVLALARAGYYGAGVRFDASPLPWYWQFVDPGLLRADLGRSIWYLHSQPPGFNLFLGVVLHLFPGHVTAAFHFCYLLLGLVFAVTMFLLLRESGVPDAASGLLTAAYVASPACVLYENWLFYTYPVTVLLLLAAFFWQRSVRRGRFIDALLLFACGAALALTWSLFHLVWLVLLVVILILARRRGWRKAVAAAAVPVLVVVFWYGKNRVQVGDFTASTWFGLNFSKMTNSMLTAPERRALHGDGIISAVSLVPPFSGPGDYYGAVPRPLPRGIPVLDQEVKPSGAPNFNNTIYLAVSRQYGRDALRVLAARPAAYARGLAESYLIYFLPASAYLLLGNNAAHVKGLASFASILDGRFVYHFDRSLRQSQTARYYLQGMLNTGWFLVLAYAFVLVFGLRHIFRSSSLRTSLFPSLLFCWFNVAWMTFVANGLEVGENNRFRFVTDPLVFAFLATAAATWLTRRAGRAQPATRK